MSEETLHAKKKLIAGHLESQKDWARNYRRMLRIHYAIGISAVVLTVLGASGLINRFDALWRDLILYFSCSPDFTSDVGPGSGTGR